MFIKYYTTIVSTVHIWSKEEMKNFEFKLGPTCTFHIYACMYLFVKNGLG